MGNDCNAYAYSKTSKGAWMPCRRKENGHATAWLWGSLLIREGRNSAGLLCFKVLFPDGKHCYQATLAEAQDYAEAWCARE